MGMELFLTAAAAAAAAAMMGSKLVFFYIFLAVIFRLSCLVVVLGLFFSWIVAHQKRFLGSGLNGMDGYRIASML